MATAGADHGVRGQVETWAEILRPQALDLSLLTAFLALALVSFFRKSVRLKYVDARRGGRLPGLHQEPPDLDRQHLRRRRSEPADLQVQPRLVPVRGFTVVSTVLWGRLYCGRICAFGALTQLMDAVVPAKLRVELPARHRAPRRLRSSTALLGGVVVYFLATTRHRRSTATSSRSGCSACYGDDR